MSIDTKTVQKIAKLARIKLGEGEDAEMAAELSGIISWVEQLGAVNTDGVPQMFGHSGMTLPMREDKVTDGNKQDAVVANAPISEYGCFVVPKVVE